MIFQDVHDQVDFIEDIKIKGDEVIFITTIGNRRKIFTMDVESVRKELLRSWKNVDGTTAEQRTAWRDTNENPLWNKWKEYIWTERDHLQCKETGLTSRQIWKIFKENGAYTGPKCRTVLQICHTDRNTKYEDPEFKNYDLKARGCNALDSRPQFSRKKFSNRAKVMLGSRDLWDYDVS